MTHTPDAAEAGEHGYVIMDLIYAQMLTEMQQPDFAAMQYYLSAWGQR